jgi:hypothetical protein
MNEGRSNFEETMNQAIEEELQKGEPIEDIGKKPIGEGEIRPPTLEERIKARRQREAAGQGGGSEMDKEEELPEIEVVEVLTEEPETAQAGKEAAREAAAVVEQRRGSLLEGRIKSLMQQLEKFDQLQGQGVKPDVAEKIRTQLEADKKALLMDIWSDAVGGSSPETQVFVTQLGERNAKPGDMDTFGIGVRELAKNFQAVAGKMNIASNLLDRLKSDRKYVRAGVPQTEEQWDKKVNDTRGRIQKDFKTFVDQQMKLRQRLSRQRGEDRDQAAAA